ncbi:AlpA family transcriptional regulator [Mobilisporobacter senegalensis]|uniref:AlpA family transcriptional regulator n=1 Tax=Mobilisporobacter senegalensis TaxID=1329262 RepID=A0A3N1XTE5_9FIRM|nr:helix-turn-helix domain-containing protein [Mobilisporobacter senegalensis]ROR28137.1 AlpA family transcriptional regulator [Mobilisporobacter senegalensis]
MQEPNIEKWYSQEEITKYLGVSKDTVYRWIAKKNMPATKIGRRWKFKLSEVEEWVRNNGANY